MEILRALNVTSIFDWALFINDISQPQGTEELSSRPQQRLAPGGLVYIYYITGAPFHLIPFPSPQII